MTLADLRKGGSARIESIHTDDSSIQRLMTMGLVEGASLTFVGASLGGDPLEFLLHGSAVSLRRADAQNFQIQPDSGNG
ncbi:MAG: ferrous iron transport protein A [Candidatus Rariloculaceae bacterium]